MLRNTMYLEQSLVILEHICKQDVLGGTARKLGPQHTPIRQNQAVQQSKVMRTRLVTHVNSTA